MRQISEVMDLDPDPGSALGSISIRIQETSYYAGLDPDSVITMMREKTLSNKFRKINFEIQMEKICKITAIVFCWAIVQF